MDHSGLELGLALLAILALVMLHELRREVRVLQHRQRELMLHLGILSAEPSEEVRALAAARKRTAALRLYRQQSGLDLRDALRVVGPLIPPQS